MREIIDEYYNPLFIAPIFSFALAQLLKYLVYAVQFKVFRRERLTGAGGMPSSHSSGVCTLAIMATRIDGIHSSTFALAMILALIVMYDATGVRRAAGLHARELNIIRRNINERESGNRNLTETESDAETAKIDEKEKKIKDLKEFLGHTPLEVLCGALLGILIGMMWIL